MSKYLVLSELPEPGKTYNQIIGDNTRFVGACL